jgi:hypothetical protein
MTIANDFEMVEMTQSQADKYLRHNEDNRRLAAGVAGRLTHNFTTDANYTLDTATGAEQWRYKFMQFTDSGVVLTAGRDVIFPSKKGPEHYIHNDTAQTITVKIAGQTGVAITTGSKVRVFYNGTDMEAGY